MVGMGEGVKVTGGSWGQGRSWLQRGRGCKNGSFFVCLLLLFVVVVCCHPSNIYGKIKMHADL